MNEDCPTKLHIKRKCCTDLTNKYRISPIHSNESDVDDTDCDPTYSQENYENRHPFFADMPSTSFVMPESSSSSSSSSDSSSEVEQQNLEEGVKKGRKRSRNPENWNQNKAKKLRNSGKAYQSVSKSKKQISGRTMKPTCSEKCRLKCGDNIDTANRTEIFNTFWKLGDISKQRAFVGSCMKSIIPRYKYTNAERPRNANQAFYFTVNGLPVRVCKTFYKNTLDISDKMIRTVRLKMGENGFLQEDNRGKHNHHPQIDSSLKEDIKNHINSIPRIESHYVRSSTQREYIDGSKTITQLYKDFEEDQKSKNKSAGKYWTYYNIFTREYNIGFFQPKKDQCDQCLSYLNAQGTAKENLEEEYRKHLIEKELCRAEKKKDRKEILDDKKVVIYDLQAVLQCPRGETSAFYYKSKLNSYNLTLVELDKIDDNPKKHQAYKDVHCFYWNETEGKRGAIEIGTCILKYFDMLFSNNDNLSETGLDITFYSDNCCGQNKNKFITSLYLYAVNRYNIKSLTHKFLIKGHSQNEGDNVHSLIEKEIKKNLKSGPIYTPHQYVTIIKNARKSKPPFNVHELSHDSFFDIKKLQEDIGCNFKEDVQGNVLCWNKTKCLKFVKDKPYSFFYKTSYSQTPDEYIEVIVRSQKRRMKAIERLTLGPAYPKRIELNENKKKDLKELISKNLIPRFYADFFDSIL